MHKIWLISQREFLTRIRKKAFLISTLIGPIMMLVMMIVPYWLTSDSNSKQAIWIVDNEEKPIIGSLQDKLPEFSLVPKVENREELINQAQKSNAVLVFVSANFWRTGLVDYYSSSSNATLESIVELVLKEVRFDFLIGRNNTFVTDQMDVEIVKHPLGQGSIGIKQFVSYGTGIFIYFFIFLYGIQVMKGVIEEKTSRVIEVMLVSVKPFQLMVGKIFGMSLLGFSQFVIWAVFSSFFYYTIKSQFPIEQLTQTDLTTTNLPFETKMLFHSLFTMNWGLILFSFVLCFILGYLLYSSLFAIIGAASDADTDTQQFLFPLTVPLLLSILFLPQVMANPNSGLAQTLSYIPFSAPIILMARIPYAAEIDGFYLQYAVSLIFLTVGVLVTMWLASRVYRIGIMVYGQKTGYKEIMKWMVSGD